MSGYSAGSWQAIAKTDAINQYWVNAREASDAAWQAISELGAPVEVVVPSLRAVLQEEYRRCMERINSGRLDWSPGGTE